MYRKNLIVFAILFVALLFFSFGKAGASCEVCTDVETIFTWDSSKSSSGDTYYEYISELEDINLSTSNTITLKGYDSHGLTSISISCEMLCGKENQPCCYDDYLLEYVCPSSPKLYCSEQTENGICYRDDTPPQVSITGIPADWVNDSRTLTIYCEDVGNESGCREDAGVFYRDIYGEIIGPGGKTCKDVDIANYGFDEPLTISQHTWICAAKADKAGNIGYSNVREVKVSGDPPSAPYVHYISVVGAHHVVLEWDPIPDATFNRYEVHFSKNWNFNPDYSTRHDIDTEQYQDGNPDITKNMTIQGLNSSTTYYFHVAAVDIFDRMSYDNKRGPVSATTTACDSGEIRDCGPDNDIGRCEFGEEECVNGQWSGDCVGAVYPLRDPVWGWPLEECNGIDDDCDGLTDEDNVLQGLDIIEPMSRECPNATYVGECNPGYQYCVGGGWEVNSTGDPACSGGQGPQPEACNGLDDDCDGIIDNVNGGDSIETTKCACYDRKNYRGDLAERCNGIDDNCDERIDNVGFGYSIEETQCACYDDQNQPGDLTETCNDIDDDCNGDDFGWEYELSIDDPWQWGGSQVDETNYLTRYCGFGNCSGGEYECNSEGTGTICSTIGGSQNLAIPEICDGEDNDCDFSIDEGCNCTVGEVYECGFDHVGICTPGYQECLQEGENSYLGDCEGGVMPQPEDCGDGEDDDCSGAVDDIPWCGCANGSMGSAEVCNGIDDDCDNVIDNIEGASSVEESKCMCFGGMSKAGEKSEVCNDIDDDCNNLVDDPWQQGGDEAKEYYYLDLECGYDNSPCFGGKYVCTKDGDDITCNTMSKNGIGESDDLREDKEACNNIDDDCNGWIDDLYGFMSVEKTHCRCYDDGIPALIEFCNDIDDDCNEKIDDEIFCACLDGETKPCGTNIGICTLGERTCVNGEWGKCVGGTQPQPEICNRVDDNCNALINDVGGGFSVEETQCGCYNGRSPSIEECDGIDNDCNGRIDDDIDCSCEEGETRDCGSNVGICSPGKRSCVDGKWGECSGGILPKLEACNGKDDDCDGIIDNVNGGNSIGSTRCSCYNRFAMPGTQNELCNGIDDNCNEKVDEGCIEKEVEPAHCGNGIKDGDEQGRDCGGSCLAPCFELPTLDTWILIFAVLVAIIAIFGIFFGSSWRKEKKSLFERTKK